MTLRQAFSATAQGILQRIDNTRRQLARVSHTWKGDAWYSTPWDMAAIGWIGLKLFARDRDRARARESTLRGYAERAVWLTHFVTDQATASAIKAVILAGNSGGITVAQLDAYLSSQLDSLPLHGATATQRERMISGMRLHAERAHLPSSPTVS